MHRGADRNLDNQQPPSVMRVLGYCHCQRSVHSVEDALADFKRVKFRSRACLMPRFVILHAEHERSASAGGVLV